MFNIANVSRKQVKKLEVASIETMDALASLDHPIRGMAENTRMRLVSQARLQHARKTGMPAFELRSPEPGKGFDLLPEPQVGDLFYDIEGDPHFEGGLEYLHGVWFDGQFQAFWAHDHAAETRALAELLEFFRARLTACPDAHIYHYAPYDIAALRRLTTKYGIGEAFLDRLLRERRFVDLFAVVRVGLIGSEPNYSIKSMEAFYDRKRDGEMKTAGGSVVAYGRWRETGEQQILDEIKDYNRVDCISTEELRDWLVGIRPGGPWPSLGQDAGMREAEEDAETEALRSALAASGLPEDRQAMLFNLGLFHKREAKPAQWAVFDSVGKDEDDLIDDLDDLDDLDALAGLGASAAAKPAKRSMARTYRFRQQETKLRGGKNATVPVLDWLPATISITDLDRTSREITLKTGAAKAHLLTDRLTLHPDWPLNTDIIATALRGTLLPIQGPPGTGKTYVTARAILSLVRQGARVGVTSNSHEAIRNVLLGCLAALKDSDLPITLDLVRKTSGDDDSYPDDCPVRRATDNAEAAGGRQVVGATAWFFARDENVQAFDWLFVDEAGQVGLANMVAMGRSARNIVLVGDPRELPQVIQGAHPDPANLSCLDWMLGDHATVPPDCGIFLPVSRRMHPDVCRFISDQVYEGRLTSHPDTSRQAVAGTAFPRRARSGSRSRMNEGNAQIAPEEIEAIMAASQELLTAAWTEKDGTTRPMRQSDIIVVAPYNAQVNALRDALSEGIRVGTVDKFQGQEAPVCMVSMTASPAEEPPRGMDFLFSLNRINVAVSRAKALALVFCAPRLREAKCETVEQMRLVNTLCALPVFNQIERGNA